MRRYLHIALLLITTAMIYSPSLQHAFVYDDHVTIEENRYLENPEHLKDVLTLRTLADRHVIDGQRPMLLLTMFMDHALWGKNPAGYHATNIVLHLVCILLVYLLACRLDFTTTGSAAAATLFAFHPALTEAVLVPSFREDLLSTLFGLMFLIASMSSRAWWLAPLPLVAALASKESAIVWPVLIAWLWLCFPGKVSGRARPLYVLLTSAALAGLFLFHAFGGRPLQAADGPWNGVSLQFPANFFEAPLLCIRYIALLVWPHPLLADRVILPPAGMGAAHIAAWIVMPLLAGVIVVMRRRVPAVAAGAGWILLAFVPVSNLVPLFNPMADRFAYGMAPGFVLLVTALVARAAGEGRAMHRAILAISMAYVALTALRTPAWKNDRTLWAVTLRDEPRSARAHVWIGLQEKSEGRLDEARAFFEKAAELNPQDVTSFINLGVMDGQAGDLESAEQKFREAIERRPDRAEGFWNLSVVLQMTGRHEEAAAMMQETLRVDPNHAQAKAALQPAMPGIW